MFDNTIKDLEKLNDQIRYSHLEIEKLNSEMANLSIKITECVISSDVDTDTLSSYKETYNNLKEERNLQRSDVINLKRNMLQICNYMIKKLEGEIDK